jgi:hypothetical protein
MLCARELFQDTNDGIISAGISGQTYGKYLIQHLDIDHVDDYVSILSRELLYASTVGR